MTWCNACGGIIGRDCFHPRECAEITASIQRDQEAAYWRDQEQAYWREQEQAYWAEQEALHRTETPPPAAGQESPVGCAAELRRSGHQCPNNQPREPK